MLKVESLSVQAGGRAILRQISFKVEKGQWLMVAGPNGSGKTTLVNAISKTIPAEGRVLFEGRDIFGMRDTERARYMGVLSQSHHVGYPFTVEEVVRLGRYAYAKGPFSSGAEQNEKSVEEALLAAGLIERRHQSVLTLSGGELQRTFLAQLLAQDPRLLILDEPGNHLDLDYQKRVFELIRDWMGRGGRAVISVVHDLSLAKTFGTRAMLMDKGRQVAFGPTQEVLNRQNLKSVYALDVHDWMQKLLTKWQE